MRFAADLRLVATVDGGRQSPASAELWRPTFRLNADADGATIFFEGSQSMEPGGRYRVNAELLSPHLFVGRILPNVRFGLYEGTRLVAEGVIIEVT